MKKRILTVLAAIALVFILAPVGSVLPNGTSYAASTFTLNYPTQEQIRAKYLQYAIDMSSKPVYTAEYSITSPYAAGDISDKDRQNALNAVNFIRYIAGLPADVVLNDEYNQYAQAGSLVNAANNKLTHTPTKPSGMSDELYNMGYTGTSGSNIAVGYTNLADSIIRGYMEDSDDSNISRVGHRRWLLSPRLKNIGFGQVGRYSATYVFGTKRTETFAGDYVAWPPPNMPVEIYDLSYVDRYAFSVTLGNAYDTPDLSKVTVEIYSKKQNKTWNLDKNCTDYSKYLTVENSWYGDPKCIIFNVGMFSAGDTVSVKIKGIYKSGVETPISYNVNFFELNAHSHSYSSKVTKPATCTETGVRTYTCTGCGDKYTEVIPKSAHNFSTAWTIDKAATCTTEGSKSHHCLNCVEKSNITVIPKTAHSYISTITKPASCTETGVRTYTCSVCGDKYTEVIPKSAHNFSTAWTIDKVATCTTEGSKSHHCLNCGEKSNITVIPKTAHSYISKITKPASCTETGTLTYTCNVCGEHYSEVIAKTEHSFGSFKVVQQPTVEKEGSEERTCSDCGKTETRAIPKLTDNSSGNSSSGGDSSSSDIENSSDESSQNPDDNESGSGDNSEDNSEYNSNDNSNDNSGDNSSENSNVNSGVNSGENSGNSSSSGGNTSETGPIKPDNSEIGSDNNSSENSPSGVASSIVIMAAGIGSAVVLAGMIILIIIFSKRKKKKK